MHDVELEVHDVASNSLLWSRHFPGEIPGLHISPQSQRLVIDWPLNSSQARPALSGPDLTRQVASINDPSAAFAVQVLDLRTGKPLGTVLVDTGKESFRILNVQAAGSQVVVSDNLHRVLVYSLTGKAEERLFGRRPSISPSGTLLSLENETGALLVYELGSMRQLAEFRFPSAVAFSRFTADDNTLFVLTADQTAYALRLPPTPLQATATDH